MLILQAILELLLFLIAIVACFYLPGKYILLRLKLSTSFLEDIFLSSVLGILISTLLFYITSYVTWVLALPILLLIDVLSIREKNWLPQRVEKKDIRYLLVVGIFGLLFALPMITNGQFGTTLRLNGINLWDGMWHIELINELRAHFPPEIPGYAGVKMTGYHFFYNLLLARISNLFFIPPLALLFHFFPILISSLWGLGVYTLIFNWTRKRSIALWSTFFSFFGGSFGFILYLQGHTKLSINSGYGVAQSFLSQQNPPYAFSILLILAFLLLVQKFYETKNNNWLVPIMLCVGLATMFKVYAGMLLIVGIIVLAIIELLKRNFFPVLVGFASLLLLICTYGLFADPNSKLIWAPLWPPHKMLEDSLTWYGYTEKMYTYTKLGVIRGIIETEWYGIYTFFLGNMGTRIIGFFLFLFLLFKNKNYRSPFTIIFLTMSVTAIGIPMFFIQSGKVFEIIQLAWYFLFFCGLLAGIGIGKLLSLRFHIIAKLFLGALLIVATIPGIYEDLKGNNFFLNQPIVSQPFLNATYFLSQDKNYDNTILVLPPKEVDLEKDNIGKWYIDGGPHIIGFANKNGYVSYINHTFPNTAIHERLAVTAEITRFARSNNPVPDDILKKTGAQYLYTTSTYPGLMKTLSLRLVFQNEYSSIYTINFAK